MAKYKLFDFLNDINHEKKNILKNDPEFGVKEYSPWIVNVGLSLFPDTILYANDMNQYYHLSKEMQYDYYIHSIRSRKRFAKWPKKQKSSNDVEIVKKFFNINSTRAEEYLEFLPQETINKIKKQTSVGGIKK